MYERVSSDPEMKLIGVGWVKVNKGTRDAPRVRRRLVAQELFAAHLLFLDSGFRCGSVQPGSKSVLAMDVKCPSLHGAAKRKLAERCKDTCGSLVSIDVWHAGCPAGVAGEVNHFAFKINA